METISATDLRPQLTSTISKVESGNHVAVTKLNLIKIVLVDVAFYKRAVKALGEGAKNGAGHMRAFVLEDLS